VRRYRISTPRIVPALAATFLLASSSVAQTAAKVVRISAISDNVKVSLPEKWGILIPGSGEWTRMRGPIIPVSVRPCHNLWDVAHEQKLVRLTPAGWLALSGLCKTISTGVVAASDTGGGRAKWLSEAQGLSPLASLSGGPATSWWLAVDGSLAQGITL
jgi:hypothetical protein